MDYPEWKDSVWDDWMENKDTKLYECKVEGCHLMTTSTSEICNNCMDIWHKVDDHLHGPVEIPEELVDFPMVEDKWEVSKKVSPMPGQILRRVDVLNSGDYSTKRIEREIVGRPENANVITSEVSGTHDHKPVLDIDLGVKLIPSTTEGHYHLLIDHQMGWDRYLKLLTALQQAGIIEQGYLDAAKRRKYTAVRLPWIKKVSNDG